MSKYKIKRKLPENLNNEDLFMFEHEFERSFQKIKLINKKNIYINKFQFFKGNKFLFGSKYWNMNEYKFKRKLKTIVKNLFLKNNHSKIEIIKNASWIANEKSHNYFHWFGDALQRVEFLIEKKYPELILLSKNYENKEYVTEILDGLNLNYIFLDDNKTYLVENLDITTHAAVSGNFDSNLINNISKRLKNLYLEENNKNYVDRIWISRQSADKRKISNTEEVFDILDDYDFKIIEFENLKLIEQIQLVNSAKVLGGVHGAGLTNMLFLDKNKDVIEIRGSGDYKNNCFYSLSSALDLNYYYFLAKVENNNYYGSDYFVDPQRFKSFLKLHFPVKNRDK